MTWRIVAIVIAALCFIAVLLGFTGEVDVAKVLAAGGLLTLVAVVPFDGRRVA